MISKQVSRQGSRAAVLSFIGRKGDASDILILPLLSQHPPAVFFELGSSTKNIYTRCQKYFHS